MDEQYLSTGQVAERLGISEPYLQDLIRRGKIQKPPKICGRRQWTEHHVTAAKLVLSINSVKQ